MALSTRFFLSKTAVLPLLLPVPRSSFVPTRFSTRASRQIPRFNDARGVRWPKTSTTASVVFVSTALAANAMTSTDPQLELLASSKVAIFTTSGCKYCKLAKETLQGLQVAYQEIDVSNSPELRSKLKEATGSRTVPQIYVGGKLIGGSSDLVELVNKGELTDVIEGASTPALPAQMLSAVRENWQPPKAEPEAKTPYFSEEFLVLRNVADRMCAGIVKEEWRKGFLGGQHFPNTFTGKSVVNWLVANEPQQAPSREQGRAVAQQLMEARLLYDVLDRPGTSTPNFQDSEAARYRLRADALAPKSGDALNQQYIWYGDARPALTVVNELRASILALYDKHLSKDGKAISYKAIAQDPLWQQYVDATAELQRVDITPLTREELLSMFINTYNALIIHALVMYGTPANMLDRLGLYGRSAKYNIGGRDYSADDMEHGVLRGNQVSPASLGALLKIPFLRRPTFGKDDPRINKVVSPMDPRIHFALSCGAKSCPPIKLYTPETLEEGLTGAAESFLQSEVEVDTSARKVTLTMILKWYGDDFGQDEKERLNRILPWLSGDKRTALEALLKDGGSITVEYRPYDWGLNEQEE